MQALRIGAFDLYPSERLLLGAGQPLDLGARAFDLLLVLAGHAGQLVTKAVCSTGSGPAWWWTRTTCPRRSQACGACSAPGRSRRYPGSVTVYSSPWRGSQRSRRGPSEATPPLSQSARRSEPGPTAAGTAAGTAAPTSGQERAGQAPAPTAAVRAWPNRLGPLIGREQDVRQVLQALGRSALVTIVGIAGVGKTRLAQEILASEMTPRPPPPRGCRWPR